MVLIGRSSDRSGERFMHVAIPTAIGALGFVATAILKSPIPAMIALTVAAVGDYGTRGPFWALPGKFLTGSAAAAGIALDQRHGRGRRLHRPVRGRLSQGRHRNFESGLFLLAGILLIGSMLTLLLRSSPALKD